MHYFVSPDGNGDVTLWASVENAPERPEAVLVRGIRGEGGVPAAHFDALTAGFPRFDADMLPLL